jgi:hypothetical protein
MKLKSVFLLMGAFYCVASLAKKPCTELLKTEAEARGVASDSPIANVRKELAKKTNQGELTNIIAHFWSQLESGNSEDINKIFNSVPQDSGQSLPTFLNLSSDPSQATEEAREVAIYLARAIDKRASSTGIKSFLEKRSKSGGLASINSYCSHENDPTDDPFAENGASTKSLNRGGQKEN